MKVLCVCVNFNSYQELYTYVDSLDRSISQSDDSNIFVDLYIADNSTIKKDVKLITSSFTNVIVKLYNNLGYLGASQKIINEVPNICEYDYVIISNVDLQVDINFFTNLVNKQYNKNVAWIAPAIISGYESRDKNPKVKQRYSKKKLRLIQTMYKFPLLHYAYNLTLYKRKRRNKVSESSQNIYAGHGSFMILTKSFFEAYKKIEYPIFLFGEELYLAELILKSRNVVFYDPELLIFDNEHVSTKLIKKQSYYKYNYNAITYILNTFYE